MAAHDGTASNMLVAYFSMEYGLLDCMPIYSGGLGVLSGDHLKASSDAILPLVGIGSAVPERVFPPIARSGRMAAGTDAGQRFLFAADHAGNSRGWQRADRGRAGRGHRGVSQSLAHRCRAREAVSDGQQHPAQRRPVHRDITGQLYGGDLHKRIRQEIVLGIGGLRALKELGLQPTVYHMNEGHSAFLAIERIRLLMAEQQLSFEEALEASRTNNVFTTHTPVPAGIDLFDAGLMCQYFESIAAKRESPSTN